MEFYQHYCLIIISFKQLVLSYKKLIMINQDVQEVNCLIISSLFIKEVFLSMF
jgi:hypothetical protein